MDSPSLRDVVERLANAVGVDTPVDSSDEHVRWDVYWRAFGRQECEDLLRSAVAIEPDRELAVGVVMEVAGRSGGDGGESWLALLPVEWRDYPERRLAEIRTLRRARESLILSNENIDDWTDWLQRRAAEEATDKALLETLAREGRTKRVRNLARERLRHMRE